MQWNSAAEFFAMGGYASYVWGSFGLTLLGLAWEVSALALRRRKAIRRIRQARAWAGARNAEHAG
ncbi:heme exporter protein CcmD [Methylobacillus sp. Pita1]|uniref:heme exporter protein CcmD n=1 Tax=Methylobacillus sp. Pita1 TaxID=3382642 RepID=UPI0038B6A718